ncbi:MAG TPA: hypothetical protein VGK73_09850, partial [Polyangiaceae bacterium]
HPRALAYEPGYPLWSNGSDKRRYLVLPPGEIAESDEAGAFRFPVGTLFLKTFSYPAPDGGERPIETRVLQNAEDGWQYAVYAWDESGGASLIDLARSTKVEVELDGERFEHVVPSKLDCRKCHESGLGSVLGFREIQLGAARDGTNELARLHERGVFGAGASFDPERIEHADPVTEAVLGYLQGNCVHCHNGGAPPAAFDMQHGVALENLIGKDTQGELLSGVRVVPADPEASVVFLTLARRTDVDGILPMPPVGVQRTDASAVELFRGWIENLAPLENDDD